VIDSNGRTIWIPGAHRDDGKGLVVHADEKLTAFLELESAIRTVSPLKSNWAMESGPADWLRRLVSRVRCATSKHLTSTCTANEMLSNDLIFQGRAQILQFSAPRK
jgi:hypothetical protein